MLYIIDLFCGAGGFSEGARQAGATVILAVDHWHEALDVHTANHPNCVHWLEELGGDPAVFAARLRAMTAERVPPEGRLHLHASPPCQNLSYVNRCRMEAQGMRLVWWTLDVIDMLRPHTFTLEQVPNLNVLRGVDHVPHRVYCLHRHGVPQTRRRLILGWAPELPLLPAESLGKVLSRLGVAGITQTTAGMRKGSSYAARATTEVASTVTSCFPVEFTGGKMRTLPLSVLCELQTFPTYYKWGSRSSRTTRLLLANAVPPAFAALLLHKLTRELPHEGCDGAMAPSTAAVHS